MTKHCSIEFNGKKYKNQKSLAFAFGIKQSTFNTRLAKGLSVEDALKPPQPRHQCKTITAMGKEYKSNAELARAFNMSVSTVSHRLRRGLTPEQAISKFRIETDYWNIEFKGVIYNSKSDLADRLNIPRHKLNDFLKGNLKSD